MESSTLEYLTAQNCNLTKIGSNLDSKGMTRVRHVKIQSHMVVQRTLFSEICEILNPMVPLKFLILVPIIVYPLYIASKK